MEQISLNIAADAATRNTPSRFQDMSSEDFIRIIFTELSNQDPFQPNDSAALLEQLDSIRSIESDITLTQKLDNLVLQNQLSAAGTMVGKFVGGLTETAERVAGYVVGVSRAGNEVHLELDNGWVIPMKNVETILDPSVFEEPDDTTT